MVSRKLQKAGVLALSTLLLAGCNWGQPAAPGQPSGSQESPTAVLRTMQAKIQDREMKSGGVKGTLMFDFASNDGKGKFSVGVDSEFDVGTKGKEKVKLALDLSGEGTSSDLSGKGNIKAELVVLEEVKTLFLKLIELKATSEKEPALQSQIDLMTQQYMGQWWKFPVPEGSSMFGYETMNSNMNADQEAKIKDLVQRTDFFNVTKDYGVEKVNGVDTYHYGVELNVDNTINFAKEVSKIMGETFTATDEQEMRDGLKKVTLAGELWIGVQDKFVYKGKLDVNVNDPEQNTQMTVSGEMTLDATKAVSISEPAGAKDFQVPGMSPTTMPEVSPSAGDDSMMEYGQ